MKIVEYNHSYAQKVAEMWNKSNESWGNDDTVQTKEDIIATESTSGNLKLYLAIDNDEVVGYCSLSEYKQDEGASYLPLLNVVPGYHGKKVGKKLILKVLEDAIVTKWPRFDLYTWSGNIKAMPLYKKCGFFWERKNDTVHLMNFIPYLYQTKALEEYLKNIDWYKDSKRIIDMEQDGIKRNDFEYYRYDFENETTKLAIEFEKTGRGIRYIDTPDYSIEVTINDHDLVFDTEYNVTYKIMNKKKTPLEIILKGKDNKNIKFDLDKTIVVKQEKIITESFYVGEITKDQQKGKTHPVVETDVFINGLHASFKVGIEPKYPIKLNLRPVEYNHVLHKEYECYLDIENNLSSKETFNITLPKGFVVFEEDINITLQAKQKKSLTVLYKLNDYGFYKEDAEITYSDKEVTKVVKKTVFAPFKGANKSFTCELENQVFIVSGNYILRYNIISNNLALIQDYDIGPTSSFMVPSIGKPYSLEFNNIRPAITFTSDNDMEVVFTSKTFKDVILKILVNHSYGLATVRYELINLGDKRELALSIPVWYNLKDNIIPYNKKLLNIPGVDGIELAFLDHDLIDENWLYNRKLNYGFTWDKDLGIKISGWKLSFGKENLVLDTNESHTTPNFYMSFVHQNVKAIREFSGNKEEKRMMGYTEFNVNNGNPFSTKKIEVQAINNKKTDFKGSIIVDDSKENVDSKVVVTPGLHKIKLDLKDRIINEKRLTFNVSGTTTLLETDGVLEVNNGNLSFKASNDYADSIYSILFNNQEWLDSNYPTPKERVWWGDFVGGITQRCESIQDISALKEQREVKFISLKDNFGNEWSGIKTSLLIQKDEGLKGLRYDSYTLTLPGTNVVHTFSNIINDSGKIYIRKGFHRFNTLKVDDDPSKVKFIHKNHQFKCDDIQFMIHADKLATFKSSREYMMHIYNPENEMSAESQKGFTILFSEGNLTIPDGKQKQFRGDFIVFDKNNLDKDMLQDLDNIRFEV